MTQIPDSDGGGAGGRAVLRPRSRGRPARPHAALLPVAHRGRFRQRRPVGGNRDADRAQTALGPFRFTMMGDQGTDAAPERCRAGLARGDYDDSYYKPDNDPGAAHTANVLNQLIASQTRTFTCSPGTSPTRTPRVLGKPATFVRSGGRALSRLRRACQSRTCGTCTWGRSKPARRPPPWMFATGNHDMEAAYPTHGYGGHLARLDFPGNGPAACPSVYSFVYGNVAVLSLDANDVTYEITANTGYSGGAQNTWVERTLAAHRANAAIDFIVCFFHHCAYSTTEAHASDGGVRAAWCDLFDRYQVDRASRLQPRFRAHGSDTGR